MFLRVNGLFGWVRTNDRRSVTLFAGFALALNLAAVLALYLPLAALDIDHAPFFAWGGYVTRYVPLVTLAGGVVFALQMAWHVRSVQKLIAFAFVDDSDEPRLCGIVEPLAIAMGLPVPYVGVVETPALNAFACGLTRGNAVVVVTRGLVDALDDDELGAVVAHELAHIANGDIRLLAAADTCLGMVGTLLRRSRAADDARRSPWRQVVIFPLMMLVMPAMFLFVLILGFLAQLALRSSSLTRLMITSAREFVADAAAIEVTRNPAALVSALRRIDGNSWHTDLAPGQDAMMIDGLTQGRFATHPTIADRIAAIVSVTGSVALIAPAGRDTRPQPASAPVMFGRRGTGSARQPLGDDSGATVRGGESGDEPDWFGLTPAMRLSAIVAVVLFIGLHLPDLGNPRALVAALDPRPFGRLVALSGRGASCNFATLGTIAGADMPDRCGDKAIEAFEVERAKALPPTSPMLASLLRPLKKMFPDPAPAELAATPVAVPHDDAEQEARDRHCFRTETYSPGDRGMHTLSDPADTLGIDLTQWLEGPQLDAGKAVFATGTSDRDRWLKSYVEQRKVSFTRAHRFFGEPGAAAARASYDTFEQHRAIALIRERISDSRFANSVKFAELEEMALLVNQPDDFVSCTARREKQAS